MRIQSLKTFLLCLTVGISVSCQRTWHADPALQKTLLGVSETITADAQTEKMIAPYRAKVTKQMAEVIGVAPVSLEKLAVESPAGNFVADLQRIQAEKLTGKPVDIGLMTAGGVRTPIRQGNLTVGDIFELMPFENELMVITVPAVVVKQLLIFAAQPHIYALAPKTISTSNVTYQIQNNQPQNIMIGGQPFDSTRTYTIALSDYLAKGGDNLEFIKNQVSSQKAGMLLREVIIKHIKELTAEGKPVEASVEGRVQVIVPTTILTPVEPKR
ncbi:5'-nucleotidase C-terminal domain-containing protein [Adhaeribacter terreus]|uniref:5'-nucleotidase C-terminal domain-containing protein n=1 Tax=Adhaeribacter terreus TaxID=529703 RepID=A0ABW0E9I5_9BACT